MYIMQGYCCIYHSYKLNGFILCDFCPPRVWIHTYVAGRSGQCLDSSLELCSNIGHSNSFQECPPYALVGSWYIQQQHMILYEVGER